ncbi:MAG: glycerol-3-phosphate dehydrogenase, partial [Alphaproteobacteria bacterium]
AGARGLHDLGADLGGGLYEAEADYLRRAEWAEEPADILWRRSKLGLHVPPGTEDRLAAWLDGARVNRVPSRPAG